MFGHVVSGLLTPFFECRVRLRAKWTRETDSARNSDQNTHFLVFSVDSGTQACDSSARNDHNPSRGPGVNQGTRRAAVRAGRDTWRLRVERTCGRGASNACAHTARHVARAYWLTLTGRVGGRVARCGRRDLDFGHILDWRHVSGRNPYRIQAPKSGDFC